MFYPRIIPLLLLKGKGLVKTIKFKHPRYIGDPINAVRILNDLKADELVFLDITASKEKRTITTNLVKDIGDEAFMPFGVGGGINTIEQIEKILKAGAEKVIINTHALRNSSLISEAAKFFGNQSIVVSIDIKKSLFQKYEVWTEDGCVNTRLDPIYLASKFEDLGAGELLINSIDKDGTMSGYDLELIKKITDNVRIPVVAAGGAGTLNDFKMGFFNAHASALAAGSMFVYHGPRKAVLINYPSKEELKELFS